MTKISLLAKEWSAEYEYSVSAGAKFHVRSDPTTQEFSSAPVGASYFREAPLSKLTTQNLAALAKIQLCSYSETGHSRIPSPTVPQVASIYPDCVHAKTLFGDSASITETRWVAKDAARMLRNRMFEQGLIIDKSKSEINGTSNSQTRLEDRSSNDKFSVPENTIITVSKTLKSRALEQSDVALKALKTIEEMYNTQDLSAAEEGRLEDLEELYSENNGFAWVLDIEASDLNIRSERLIVDGVFGAINSLGHTVASKYPYFDDYPLAKDGVLRTELLELLLQRVPVHHLEVSKFAKDLFDSLMNYFFNQPKNVFTWGYVEVIDGNSLRMVIN